MADNTKKRGPGRPPGSKNKKKTEENIPKVPKSKEEQIKELQQRSRNESRVNDAIWAVAIFAMGLFFFFTVITDTTGEFGAYIHDICMGLFGIMAYIMPFYFIIYAILLFMKRMQHINLRTVLCSVFLFLDLCILNSYRFIDERRLAFAFGDIADYYKQGVAGDKGGAIGMEFASLIVKGFGMPGLIIFGVAAFLICLLLIVNTPISESISRFREKREAKRLLRQMEEAERQSMNIPVQSGASAIPSAPSLPQAAQPVKVSESVPEPVKTHPIEIVNTSKPTVLPNVDFDRAETATGASSAAISTPVDIIPEEPASSVSYGLDGDIPLRTGFGLGDYGLKHTGASAGTTGLAPVEAVEHETASTEPERAVPRPRRRTTPKTEEPKADEHRLEVNAFAPATAAAAPVITKKATKRDMEEQAAEDDLSIERELESAVNDTQAQRLYELPDVGLLKLPKKNASLLNEGQLQDKAMQLEKTFRDFGVSATVVKVTQGASVTRYEVQPATGVKVNKITALADDIALNMRAKSIRMEAPIPGKAAVGIEIENDKAAPVLVRELIDSEEFRKSESKISFVVGKDISGRNIVADLKGMPHMLIAGATGSGKSVCINTIITSILYKANPYEVKFIMIDPKVVELGNYNGIPHMSIPVVTDPKKAARALNWAVGEMNKRYEEFANVRVKDLESYNDYARANHMEVKPQIVIIIDELADLMMAAPSQVEESICRLAQKARAAGMHLIVATQRPSVDIVTGVIKANIPSRIAFSVSSQFDSRTILDMAGAEKLLGKGDMLFYPVGSNKPLRVQGPYISDSETAAVIDYTKKQADPDYDKELADNLDSDADPKGGSSASGGAPDKDELTEDAIEFILKSKQASVSMLQRRFRIGYNRAARIIDEIEAMGIIGPSDGSRPRQVLVTEEQYYGADEQITVDELEDDSEAEDTTDNYEV